MPEHNLCTLLCLSRSLARAGRQDRFSKLRRCTCARGFLHDCSLVAPMGIGGKSNLHISLVELGVFVKVLQEGSSTHSTRQAHFTT